MKRYGLLTLLLTFFLIGNTRDVAAQHSVGANVGYNLEAEEFFLGGQFRYDPVALPVIINPSLETYFIPNVTWLQIDVNALYPFGVQNTLFTPYAGAGLGIDFAKPEDGDSSTDAGLNLLFGANWSMTNLRPFTEARLHVDEGLGVSVRGGLLIGL